MVQNYEKIAFSLKARSQPALAEQSAAVVLPSDFRNAIMRYPHAWENMRLLVAVGPPSSVVNCSENQPKATDGIILLIN